MGPIHDARRQLAGQYRGRHPFEIVPRADLVLADNQWGTDLGARSEYLRPQRVQRHHRQPDRRVAEWRPDQHL